LIGREVTVEMNVAFVCPRIAGSIRATEFALSC
jgi:hypothetical protein